MAKVILISQKPLPDDKIGSWTTLYRNYLESDHRVDYIVCPKTNSPFKSIQYVFFEQSFKHKFRGKFLKKFKSEYTDALDEIVSKDEKFVIQIVDNHGIVKPIHDYLIEKGIRQNCYIQFFYHGFSPYNQPSSFAKFYSNLDEIIVLTQLSYLAFKQQITVLPNYFSILHNGIDTSKFKQISTIDKDALKQELEVKAKKVFLWCSQDRPKKGLHIILDAWRKIYNSEQNIELLVIGCDPKESQDGVRFLGKIPNDELPKYYQISDCFLFSTLCHEGFGLTLIEALHSGCYCIASDLGGVPEVLQHGKLGKLISNPHFVSDWENAITQFLQQDMPAIKISEQLYSTQKWNSEMNEIINQAKSRISHNSNLAKFTK